MPIYKEAIYFVHFFDAEIASRSCFLYKAARSAWSLAADKSPLEIASFERFSCHSAFSLAS